MPKKTSGQLKHCCCKLHLLQGSQQEQHCYHCKACSWQGSQRGQHSPTTNSRAEEAAPLQVCTFQGWWGNNVLLAVSPAADEAQTGDSSGNTAATIRLLSCSDGNEWCKAPQLMGLPVTGEHLATHSINGVIRTSYYLGEHISYPLSASTYIFTDWFLYMHTGLWLH